MQNETSVAQTSVVPAFYGVVNGVQVTEEEYKALMAREYKPAKRKHIKTFPHRPGFSLMR